MKIKAEAIYKTKFITTLDKTVLGFVVLFICLCFYNGNLSLTREWFQNAKESDILYLSFLSFLFFFWWSYMLLKEFYGSKRELMAKECELNVEKHNEGLVLYDGLSDKIVLPYGFFKINTTRVDEEMALIVVEAKRSSVVMETPNGSYHYDLRKKIKYSYLCQIEELNKLFGFLKKEERSESNEV